MAKEKPENAKGQTSLLETMRAQAEGVMAGGDIVQWAEPGNFVLGKVIGFRQIDTDLGRAVVCDLEEHETNETVTFFCTPYEIGTALQQYQVVTGDDVYFEYLTDEDLGGGKVIKRFKCAFRRNGKMLSRPKTTYLTAVGGAAPRVELGSGDDGSDVPF